MTSSFFKILFTLSLGACSSLFPTPLSVDMTMEKMLKNSRKAIEEHARRSPNFAYASLQEGLPSIETMTTHTDLPPLNFSYVAAEDQGVRESMEDAHFFKEIEQGVIIGVLDGHGGVEVARFASELFWQRFPDVLTKVNGNVREAFETLIHEIHQKVAAKAEWNHIGSTAVLCFIDKSTHHIYTATLGDSEANIYRKNKEGNFQSIPISCVRDWSSLKDAKRAALALGNPRIAIMWPQVNDPKRLRYPSPFFGINISRCIGDVAFHSAVIHKPKITVNKLQVGDILILGCDGLKDYVPENEIVDQLYQTEADENLAKRLVKYAINVKKSLDNVTILVVTVD
ncbi:MAG: PP2C family protein-serine/threonine phosphatase [Chlamydiota bacterium]